MSRYLFVVLLAALALSPPVTASAQTPLAHRGSGSTELFAGYSYSFRNYDHNQDNNLTGGMNGWQASLKLRLLPWIGLKFDGSGYYRADDGNPTSKDPLHSCRPGDFAAIWAPQNLRPRTGRRRTLEPLLPSRSER